MLPFYYYGFTGVRMIQPYGQAGLEIAGVQLVTSMIHGQGEIILKEYCLYYVIIQNAMRNSSYKLRIAFRASF